MVTLPTAALRGIEVSSWNSGAANGLQCAIPETISAGASSARNPVRS